MDTYRRGPQDDPEQTFFAIIRGPGFGMWEPPGGLTARPPPMCGHGRLLLVMAVLALRRVLPAWLTAWSGECRPGSARLRAATAALGYCG